MLGDFLDVRNNGVSLFIKILLAETENQVQHELKLHNVVKHIEKGCLGSSECWVISISENIIAGDKQHENIEHAFPGRIFLDHKAVENIFLVDLLTLFEIDLIEIVEGVIIFWIWLV